MDNKKCDAGCIVYDGGERRHTETCPFYEESLTKLNKELIDTLKKECKRVKIQRNQYEQELLYANRKIVKLRAELLIVENKLKSAKNLINKL